MREAIAAVLMVVVGGCGGRAESNPTPVGQVSDAGEDRQVTLPPPRVDASGRDASNDATETPDASDDATELPDAAEDAPNCGDEGQPCCVDETCRDSDLSCVTRSQSQPHCERCGNLDDPCCPGQECKGIDTVCVGNEPGRCTQCGSSDESATNPCCAGNRCNEGNCCISLITDNLAPYCKPTNTLCWDQAGGLCDENGSCAEGSCGGESQACCTGGGTVYCSASGTTCLASDDGGFSCVSCGKQGQPCCHTPNSQLRVPQCEGDLACTAMDSGDWCL